MLMRQARRYGLAASRALLDPLLSWRALCCPAPGFSIILGVPWMLRHLLSVNLKFVAATDISELHKVHVVFDRTHRSEAEALMDRVRSEYPQLPLRFHFYQRGFGWIVERLNTSNFYNSTNCFVGLRECESQYAIVHDFDLYPLTKDHFSAVVGWMRRYALNFSGLEHTHVDGLTEQHRCLGTWALGIDARWLRASHRPISIYHRIAWCDDRWRHMDPFTYLQLHTPERSLVQPLREGTFCHVRNLPSVHLQLSKGQRPNVVWRLHYLWYLESLAGDESSLLAKAHAMETARSSSLEMNGISVDFGSTDWTCANVLRQELERMELFLFGLVRPHVVAYLDAFFGFLSRMKGGVDRLAAAVTS